MDEKNLTIGDIAEELGVSKTTVSRAISGKGRIGEKTRERVLTYIEERHYRPNVVARGLAQNKTFNLGVVLPGDYNVVELPFFQKCLIGISRVASARGYDVLLSMVTAENTNQLKRAVANRKIDGAILTRTLADDKPMKYLQQQGVPFVAIGSTDSEQVVQIDNDHRGACRELTERLLLSGIRKLALIGGDEGFIVTRNRRQGFEDAFLGKAGQNGSGRIFRNVGEDAQVQKIVEELLADGTECIVSMDDFLCGCVLNALQTRRIAVPEQMQVVSFYDSTLLANRSPAVTSVRFNVEELGQRACETLLAMLDGEEVERRTLLGYEVRMRNSTK
ncbi:MAG: LacI family transcriptional regulator [Bacteroidales bacterium]|nr:LacI family transcriptional regulator [Bacteroidales bacterium]MCM1416331.1 LacI family transcriptional regulator [bacterium]MCM1423256.1 LacI family transcriptional regulator [bacterium]